VISTWWQEKGR